ncbi:hypothetical protein DIT72_02145 [Marinobacter orientalis]|uniref:Transposase n=1 Tax=Marinobacter orientalis TaxID=1928859 RepID=A0A7Y0RAR4_9GAMM|nr:transposase [Marinobacter orientalis]TGX50861.1 hypothetical protein DIT72_02145 [Marinobacter orientalis]
MDRWAYERQIEIDFSRPGKPTDNASVESSNGRLRQECLNENWFLPPYVVPSRLGLTSTPFNMLACRSHWIMVSIRPSAM